MTEKKQITIYELLPMLKHGFICYDRDGWSFFDVKPNPSLDNFKIWILVDGDIVNLSHCFNIAPFDGDWKDSLMEVK